MGLDKPYVVRWFNWMSGVFTRGFGESCLWRVEVNQLSGRSSIVLGICLTALFFRYLIAIPVGIISATADNPLLNNSLRFVSYLRLAMPNFLLALMIMLFSTVVFGDSLTGLFSRNSGTLPGRMSA